MNRRFLALLIELTIAAMLLGFSLRGLLDGDEFEDECFVNPDAHILDAPGQSEVMGFKRHPR